MTLHHGVAHYENFPVASVLCPPRLRPPILAIYHFARTADDLADEGDASPSERLADLAAFRADLSACAAGAPTSERWRPVFASLSPILTQWRLPMPLLTDLLSAFEQDVVQQRYQSQAELLDYCRRSANPVGRLLLHLYGVNEPLALQQSDAICAALQLINFWQDLSVDIPRGRLYLPADLIAQHGVAPDALLAQTLTPETRALTAAAIAWAKDLMHSGAPLAKQVPGRAGWELRLVVQGGLRLAQRLEQNGFDALVRRPKIGKADVWPMLWRAWRM